MRLWPKRRPNPALIYLHGQVFLDQIDGAYRVAQIQYDMKGEINVRLIKEDDLVRTHQLKPR